MSFLTLSAQGFSEKWSAFIAFLNSSLDPDDIQSRYKNFRELFLNGGIPSSSAAALTLENLVDFMNFLSNEAKPPTDNTTFWVVVGTVSYNSRRKEGIRQRLPRMIDSIIENIVALNKYRARSPETLPEVTGACFHIAISLFTCFIAAGQFIESYTNDSVWGPLEQQFNSICSEIHGVISHLESLRAPRFDDLNRLETALTVFKPSPNQSLDEPANLPCFIYPTSRPARFFDRIEDIIQIDRLLNNGVHDNQPFRSLTLYGVGGVGKSSGALRYAEARINRKEVDAMFWIASEKEVTIRKSFTDIAMGLKLPRAKPEDHDQNRTLVLDWLRNTECKWLLVFDNVESVNLLMPYWPTASRGRAIITTRNHDIGLNLTDDRLEIIEWDTETSSQFLDHLLSASISIKRKTKKAHIVHILPLDFSGNALALSLMAGLVHHNNGSIEGLVQMYKHLPQGTNGIFGISPTHAFWDMLFQSLSTRARAILGVLTFLSPDNIPQALFNPMDINVFSDSLKFCRIPFGFFYEIKILTTLALVERNEEQRALSIHRLVQTSFKHFMSPEERQNSFNDATRLVSAAFPRKDLEFSQMYHFWEPCSLYLPHVLSLRDSFREEKEANPYFSALANYCVLNNACKRYLIETNGYNDLIDLSIVNDMAAQTIPPQPRSIQIKLAGDSASLTGQVLLRVGGAEDGVGLLRDAYRFFAKSQPRDLREEAWCAENLADGLATTNKFAEAITWQEKARNHWLEWAKDNSEDKTEWPAILKWGMGNNLVWAGQKHRARIILTMGLHQLETATPYNWAMVAYTNYALGTVARADGNFESAEWHFTQAYNKWVSGGNLLSDPFCGACVYRMGCAALDQGKVETAIKHLREAAVITERHRDKMPVEHARSLFKLSEALAMGSGDREESVRLRGESRRLLYSRLPSRLGKDTGCEKTYDDLIFIWWR